MKRADLDPHDYEYAGLCDGTSANDRRCKQAHVEHTACSHNIHKVTYENYLAVT